MDFKRIFEPGQTVKHKLGHQVMIVLDYERRSDLITLSKSAFGPWADRKKLITVYTGKVICSWVDENNFPQKRSFFQEEIEIVP